MSDPRCLKASCVSLRGGAIAHHRPRNKGPSIASSLALSQHLPPWPPQTPPLTGQGFPTAAAVSTRAPTCSEAIPSLQHPHVMGDSRDPASPECLKATGLVGGTARAAQAGDTRCPPSHLSCSGQHGANTRSVHFLRPQATQISHACPYCLRKRTEGRAKKGLEEIMARNFPNFTKDKPIDSRR